MSVTDKIFPYKELLEELFINVFKNIHKSIAYFEFQWTFLYYLSSVHRCIF